MSQNNTDDASTDSGLPECPVTGQIIHNVAQDLNRGAGGLKGLLRLRDSSELFDLDRRDQSAANRALNQQADRNHEEQAPDWTGQTVYHTGMGVGTVKKVHRQLPEEIIEDTHPIDVEFEHATETLGISDVAKVEDVQLNLDMNAENARELLEVLDAGIEAVEDDSGTKQYIGRAVRKMVYKQHNGDQ